MASADRAPPPVGRDAELGALRSIFDGLDRGAGRVVIIDGEAGSGKTTLLQHAHAEAAVRNFHALQGAAQELESDRPLGPLVPALALRADSRDKDRAEIGRLLAQGVSDGPQSSREQRFRTTDAVVGLLERLAHDGPVFLTVDDAQWADPLTITALRQGAHRLSHLPLAVVIARRPLPRSEELRRAIADIEHLPHAIRMSLGPLDQAAVRELVRQRVGADPAPDLLRLVRGAGGNPFYIDELIASLGDEDAICVADGEASVARSPTLPTFRATVLRRLDPLSQQARELVGIAAILGTSFAVSDVALVLDQAPSTLAPPLSEVMASGVFEELDDRLRFRHDVVREAAYEALPKSLRKALHLQVGRRLASRGAAATEVAFHLSAGALPGDAEAIDWLVRAARQVGPFAPTTASDLLRRAIELTDSRDPRRDLLVAELVWPLLRSGRLDEPVRLARETLARASAPEAIAQLHYLLAKGLQAQGRFAESLETLEAGLAQPGLPPPVKTRLLADLAIRRITCGDVDGARSAAEHVLEQTAASDSPGPICTALSALSLIAIMRGQVKLAGEYMRRALEVADRDGAGEAQMLAPRIFSAYHLVMADQTAEAHAVIERGRELDESQFFAPMYAAFSALALFHEGRWDDALAEAETALALAEETGLRNLSILAYAIVAHVAVHRGEYPRARRALEAADGELDPSARALIGRARLMWAKALMLEADGNAPAALGVLEDTWANLRTLGLLAEGYEMTPDLVRLAVSAGKMELAADVALGTKELVTRGPTPSVRGTASRCRGLIDGNASVLAEAVAQSRSSSRALERACACEDAGQARVHEGLQGDGVALLEEAVDIYEQIGARLDQARVNAVLRALGVRRARRGRRARPTHGWASLTPSEVEVVRLTAEGLTNRAIGARMYISPRTVQSHLSHVFSKLGCANRLELVTAVSVRVARSTAAQTAADSARR